MADASATAVYLYGVARDLDPGRLGETAGVAGTPVRGVIVNDLTALVSTVRLEEYGEDALRANLEDLTWLELTARTHHHVVEHAARIAATAPVRIATVYRDDDRVTEVLRQEGDRFAVILDRITGRSEWGVKVYAHLDQAGPEAAAGVPGASGGVGASGGAGASAGAGASGAGTAYLKRRQEQRRRREDVSRRIAERARSLEDELRDHAVAVRRHPPQDPALSGHSGTLISNMAYLLDEERVTSFRAAAEDLDRRLTGIEVEVTGPWPPYSFIDAEETAPGGRR